MLNETLIKIKLIRMGKTQTDMAKALNVSHAQLNMCINNKRRASLALAKMIADYLDLTLDELTSIEEAAA